MRNALLESIANTFRTGLALVERKNQDYGADADPFINFRSAELVGVSVERAILVRMLDKIARVSNLLGREAVVADESITDTLLDLINYTAILKAYLETGKQVDEMSLTETEQLFAALDR